MSSEVHVAGNIEPVWSSGSNVMLLYCEGLAFEACTPVLPICFLNAELNEVLDQK